MVEELFLGDIRQVISDRVLLELTNEEIIGAGSKFTEEQLNTLREEACKRHGKD